MGGFSWDLEPNGTDKGAVIESTDAASARSFPSRRDLRQGRAATGRKRPRARVTMAAKVRASEPPHVRARVIDPTPSRKLRKRLLPKLASIGAMLGVGALLVTTSLPAYAFRGSVAEAAVPATTAAAQAKTQSLAVDTAVAEVSPTRDAYTVVSLVQQIRLKSANQNFAYTNDQLGTIQWPFPEQVPISSGFGARTSPCSGCSSYHLGVDFIPGAGTPIGAIADGVVSQTSTTGAYGNHVIVDHVINGQKVQSLYAHMLAGSINVVVGQPVKVTDELGLVGSTGESTGAHLHFEVHVDGVPVDPFAWLKANAN
ncbi:M23 family metallopeptidase [Glaciihabitans sp. UYNi722]|uniref:M23 family metallopeptidase n=1 Tax=Glaciihabitans sp. UYNi722 TaxID=3156344 RepID=UPI003397FC83